MTREEAISRIQQALSVPNRPQGLVLIDEESANMAIDALQYLQEWGDVLQGKPVKHGKWIVYEMHTTQYGKVGFECSVCGVPYKLEHRLGADVGWHYCPTCGAKMDKEE